MQTIKKFNIHELQERAEEICLAYGSDRGLQAFERCCAGAITIAQLDVELNRIDAEMSACRGPRDSRYDKVIRLHAKDVSSLQSQHIVPVLRASQSPAAMASYIATLRPDLGEEVSIGLNEVCRHHNDSTLFQSRGRAASA